jgi:hypothetical protein
VWEEAGEPVCASSDGDDPTASGGQDGDNFPTMGMEPRAVLGGKARTPDLNVHRGVEMRRLK